MNKKQNLTINGRIKEIRKYFFNGKNVDFAKSIGEHSNTTSNWTRDGYNIGRGVVSKIARKFPSVNIGWLLTGEGEMLINTQTQADDHAIKGSHIGEEIHISPNHDDKTTVDKDICILYKQIISVQEGEIRLRDKHIKDLNSQIKNKDDKIASLIEHIKKLTDKLL